MTPQSITEKFARSIDLKCRVGKEAKQKAKEIILKDGFEYSLIGFSGRNLQYFKTEGKEQELAEVIDGLTHDWGKETGNFF